MRPTPHDLAACFVEMTDEEQADFFISVAHLMGRWGPLKRDLQAMSIGGHLRKCACSNDETRELVALIAEEACREHRPLTLAGRAALEGEGE